MNRLSMVSGRMARATACLILVCATPGIAQANNENFDQKVMDTLAQCRQISTSCDTTVKDAAGVLVFPSVVNADLIIGGSGGKGALIEKGRITGYYSLGSASVGLQAGVDKASQVYVFRTAAAINDLKNSPNWKAGASVGVTLITKDTNASTVAGNIFTYIFNAEGLNGGVSLDVFNIWKSGQPRPQAQ